MLVRHFYSACGCTSHPSLLLVTYPPLLFVAALSYNLFSFPPKGLGISLLSHDPIPCFCFFPSLIHSLAVLFPNSNLHLLSVLSIRLSSSLLLPVASAGHSPERARDHLDTPAPPLALFSNRNSKLQGSLCQRFAAITISISSPFAFDCFPTVAVP